MHTKKRPLLTAVISKSKKHMNNTSNQISQQLVLFQIAPTYLIKTIHDPYWDEITATEHSPLSEKTDKTYTDKVEEIAPQQGIDNQRVSVGDRVKISLEWLDKFSQGVDRRYHKYYQHKNPHDLICKVLVVHDGGGVYIPRGPNRFLYVPERYFEIAPQHNEQNSKTLASTTPCNFVGAQVDDDTQSISVISLVGAQVKNDTKKVAPQQDTHWIEKYWVERSGNKYWYYRYCWMSGRKKNRIYLGSVNSAIAKNRKSEIETAINDGQTPAEIQLLIRQPACYQSQPNF